MRCGGDVLSGAGFRQNSTARRVLFRRGSNAISPIRGIEGVLRMKGDLNSVKFDKELKKLKREGEKTKGILKGRNFTPVKIALDPDSKS
jgi:hypothetical protein